ncbi:MAG: NucA/NucB deoxyribonuclease domain-containing protein [Actinomycetota bacterium]|nr:NucA/NucB deoxyribonuclease domain-containing protein [Actinomycetota bacterium]
MGDLFSDVTSADPVIIEDNGYPLLVGSDSEAKVKPCTVDQVLKDKRCGDLKVVVIDAAKMPFISRNISLAWGEGRQSILNRDADDNNRAARYRQSCRSGTYKKQYPKGSCDEFEFASSRQGGDGARVEEVPSREQSCQGGTLSTSYRYQQINDGDEFVVVIANPDKIAGEPYAGVDIAKEQSCGI